MPAGVSTWRSATTRSAMRCGSPGDLAGALAAFDVSLSIDEDLVKRYPDNPDYQRHVTINLNWIGDLKRFDGKPAEALDPYERSRAITEKLMQHDPQNTIYRRDLSVVLGKTRRRQAGAGRVRQGAACLSLVAGDRRLSGGTRPDQCRLAARSVDQPQPGRRSAACQGRCDGGRGRIPGRVHRGARRCSMPTRKTSSASSTSPSAATSSPCPASTGRPIWTRRATRWPRSRPRPPAAGLRELGDDGRRRR